MLNDIVAAMPEGGQPDPDLVRNFLVKRIIYVLEPTEDSSAFVALVDGAVPWALAKAGSQAIFYLDPNDTTSDPDELTIRTSDNYVYKANVDTLRFSSVISRTVTEPPVTGIEIGDTYLIPNGAGGDWADYEGYKARYSARGWYVVPPYKGDWLYIEDEDCYVRFTDLGTWLVGPGNRAFDNNSVPLSAAINFGRYFIVENQTTTVPPALPNVGVAYIVGGGATGSWLGQDGKLAICEVDDFFTIYSAAEGMRAYDKSLDGDYQFNGSAWQSARGTARINIVSFTANGTYTKSARLIGARVVARGGGGGSGNSSAGTGGTTTLGSLISAPGGSPGSSTAGGAGGTGSGGDLNRTGQQGGFIPAGVADGLIMPRALSPGGSDRGSGGRPSGLGGFGCGGGGGGGMAEEWFDASEIATNETVTIGAAGTAGSNGEAGIAGELIIYEHIEI